MLHALIPGSFDPTTLGHLDLIARAAVASDTLTVAVSHNPSKNPLLPLEVRVRIIEEALESAKVRGTITVTELPSGLIVDAARELGATHLVKGIRNAADLAYEEPMARMNMALAGLDTLFLLTDPALAHISSSLVKEVHQLGGDITPFVPPAAARALGAA